MAHIEDDLRAASAAAISLIAACEAYEDSAYARERAEKGDSPTGDDEAWFDLFEHLHQDLCLRVGAMSHMLDATSDLLCGAEARAVDAEITANRFGLTLVARSLVEALAVNRYLLEAEM